MLCDVLQNFPILGYKNPHKQTNCFFSSGICIVFVFQKWGKLHFCWNTFFQAFFMKSETETLCLWVYIFFSMLCTLELRFGTKAVMNVKRPAAVGSHCAMNRNLGTQIVYVALCVLEIAKYLKHFCFVIARII